jgi:hypothetical protein
MPGNSALKEQDQLINSHKLVIFDLPHIDDNRSRREHQAAT